MKILHKNAFCKINLGLQILYKRQDGYHEINTVFTLTKLADELSISENKEFCFECVPSPGIADEENIAFKAANLFMNKSKLNNLPVKISIKKKVPAGAGLGGGSSDAASVLSCLNEFFDYPLKFSELYEIALSLGSDVPFFLGAGTAVARGRGEQLTYFDYKLPFYALIIYPNNHIPTKWAYDSLNIGVTVYAPTDFKSILLDSLSDPALLKELMFNDFEKVVFEKFPEIGLLKNKLYFFGARYAQLTGSGSAVFGSFDTIEQASKAQSALQNYYTFISEP